MWYDTKGAIPSNSAMYLLTSKGIPFRYCVQPKFTTLMMQMFISWRTLMTTSWSVYWSYPLSSATTSNTFIDCNKLTGPSMKQLGKSNLKRKPSTELMQKLDAQLLFGLTKKIDGVQICCTFLKFRDKILFFHLTRIQVLASYKFKDESEYLPKTNLT